MEREVMNAILFLNRTGVPWRYVPHDFPPHTTVFGYSSDWISDGTIEELGLHLHRMVREREGRTAEPTACVLDAQSVKAAAPSVPTDTQGTDVGNKIVGRTCSIVVDTLGLLLLVMVTATSVSDNEAGKQLLTRVAADHPTTTKARVDTGYKRSFGWIMMHRRPARDYEIKPTHSESMIRLAMISSLAKRATGETPITWHSP
ncbi:transposase [Streptomyces sp. NPDC087859]|uniref:transposase n=1 Tax=Streptomyces sp. NPDC087859 TaxID=3365812 RepID=UPI00380BEB0E